MRNIVSLQYPDEPFLSCVKDYVNAVMGPIFKIQHELENMGFEYELGESKAFYASVTDEAFASALSLTQKKREVRTIRARYVDPTTYEAKKFVNPKTGQIWDNVLKEVADISDWMLRSPKTIERFDTLVKTINTTGNAKDFKLAMNEMVLRVQMCKDAYPIYPVDGNLPKSFEGAVFKND